MSLIMKYVCPYRIIVFWHLSLMPAKKESMFRCGKHLTCPLPVVKVRERCRGKKQNIAVEEQTAACSVVCPLTLNNTSTHNYEIHSSSLQTLKVFEQKLNQSLGFWISRHTDAHGMKQSGNLPTITSGEIMYPSHLTTARRL